MRSFNLSWNLSIFILQKIFFHVPKKWILQFYYVYFNLNMFKFYPQILMHLNFLCVSTFDELKYNMLVCVDRYMYCSRVFIILEKIFFLQYLPLLWRKAFILLLFYHKIYKILSWTLRPIPRRQIRRSDPVNVSIRCIFKISNLNFLLWFALITGSHKNVLSQRHRLTDENVISIHFFNISYF